MNRRDRKAKHNQPEVPLDRNYRTTYQHTSTCATRNLTPMERWGSEKAADQPWNALASFKTNSNWRECSSDRGTSSTKGQNGSVDEETK